MKEGWVRIEPLGRRPKWHYFIEGLRYSLCGTAYDPNPHTYEMRHITEGGNCLSCMKKIKIRKEMV
ncbi:MAG: hypothetical protein C4560_02950 [Nitrospiraceae bacterium]|nr:MAG: hypothetical protein C4560_02950 [Nitrospiraceae bacterium]